MVGNYDHSGRCRPARYPTLAATACSVGFPVFLGIMDLWRDAMATTALMLAATISAIVISIPVGIWMSRSALVRQIVMPVLDLMQTLPSFVYLIPTVMILGRARYQH